MSIIMFPRASHKDESINLAMYMLESRTRYEEMKQLKKSEWHFNIYTYIKR